MDGLLVHFDKVHTDSALGAIICLLMRFITGFL
jgi:hypothetical protein